VVSLSYQRAVTLTIPQLFGIDWLPINVDLVDLDVFFLCEKDMYPFLSCTLLYYYYVNLFMAVGAM